MAENMNNPSSYIVETVAYKLLIILFVSVSQILCGQVKFYKNFESEGITSGQKIIQSDGYLIMTNTRNKLEGTYDILLIKTDLFGDSIWSKQYDFYGNLEGRDFITDETGFIILGRHMKNDWLTDLALIKINHNGDTLWTKLLDLSDYDEPKAIVKTNDGGFVITGGFYQEAKSHEIFILKSNENGDLLWLKSYGGSNYDIGMDVIKDDDGGFFITGDYNDNVLNAFLLKTDAKGDSVWMRKYFTSYNSNSNSLIKTRDGGIILMGGTLGLNNFIIKTDNLGDSLWARQYSIASTLPDAFYSIIQTDDNGYLVGGAIDKSQSQPSHSSMAIVKLDSLGNLEWYRKYASNVMYNKQVRDIIETENGYVFLGYTGLSMFTTEDKMYLISIDKQGCYNPDPIITGVDFFCSGDSTILWSTPNFSSYVWSNGIASNSIFISKSGQYSVQVIDTNDCPLWSDTVWVQEMPLPEVLIHTDGSTTICYGEKVLLNAVIQNHDSEKDYSFSWNNYLSTTADILVDTSGNYTVNVEDKYGCKGSDNIEVVVQYPFQDEKICVVTISKETGKNIVVWEKTPNAGTVSYNIYREGNFLGNVSYNDISIFTDTLADPNIRPYQYSISVLDSCGNESDKSPYHQPMFLQYVSSDLAVNLRWDEYKVENSKIDFDSYTVYRGIDMTFGFLTPIYSNIPVSVLVANDTDPNALLRRFYYRVAGVLSNPCYPSGGGLKAGADPYNQSMSNLEDNKIKETGFGFKSSLGGLYIYPNPFTDQTIIEFPNPEQIPHKLRVLDLTGKVVREIYGIQGERIELDSNGLMPGIYTIVIEGAKIYRGKIVFE